MLRTVIAMTAMLAATPALAQAGDAAKGKTVFARCMACHSVDAGVNRLGPSLSGIVGRSSGKVPGFKYSAAMTGAKIKWDVKALDAFLTKPAAKVPGNRMIFAGMPSAEDRANLIAYLANPPKK